MAFENLLTRLASLGVRHEAKDYLLSHYAPPSQDDILHDGLVGSGETVGGILGTAIGAYGGRAIGGSRGAIAGATALAPLGAFAGGWAAHGAYRQGQLIGNILTHPENWTVDAAGAIVPVLPDPASSFGKESYEDATPPLQSGVGTIGSNDSERPARFLTSRRQSPLGDGVGSWSSSVAPTGPLYAAPPSDQPGGLLGMLLDHLRDNPNP